LDLDIPFMSNPGVARVFRCPGATNAAAGGAEKARSFKRLAGMPARSACVAQ